MLREKHQNFDASPTDRARSLKRSTKAKNAAITALADTLDTSFFKAMAEPTRQQILLILLREGRSNVQEVAQHLVQDRSVVSRHLASLEQAGFVRGHKIQRFTEYELDGSIIIMKLENLLANLRAAAALCCPPPGDEG